MPRFALLLTFVFVQSLACTMVQRGVFFFTQYRAGYTDRHNLALALAVGVTYIVGALACHRLAARLGERRLALACLLGQMFAVAAAGLRPDPIVLPAALVTFSFFNGMMWPVVESYVSAGWSIADCSRAVGRFNITWSGACPPAIWLSGLLIDALGSGMFLAASALMALAGAFLLTQPIRPAHHPPDHPHRLAVAQLAGYRALLASGRWSMVASYALLFVLAPLMPDAFRRMGYGVVAATAMFGLLDAARAGMFVLMQFTERWHGRRDVRAFAALGLPIGFLLALRGGHPGLVIGGEVLFGVAMGVAYYAALYYGMLLSHASVDAGGAHESLIGSGFALGPAAALIGQVLGTMSGSAALGVLGGVLPLMLVCSAGALRSLRRPTAALAPERP